MKKNGIKKQFFFSTIMTIVGLLSLGFATFITSGSGGIGSDIVVEFGELVNTKRFTVKVNSVFDICKDGFIENEQIVDKGFVKIDIVLNNNEIKTSGAVDSQGNLNIVTLLNYKSNAAILDSKILTDIYYTIDGNDTDIFLTSKPTENGLTNEIHITDLVNETTELILTYGFTGNIYNDLLRDTVQFNFSIGVE